jgi:hypothetical protein
VTANCPHTANGEAARPREPSRPAVRKTVGEDGKRRVEARGPWEPLPVWFRAEAYLARARPSAVKVYLCLLSHICGATEEEADFLVRPRPGGGWWGTASS